VQEPVVGGGILKQLFDALVGAEEDDGKLGVLFEPLLCALEEMCHFLA
jgi:hypothetical protein